MFGHGAPSPNIPNYPTWGPCAPFFLTLFQDEIAFFQLKRLLIADLINFPINYNFNLLALARGAGGGAPLKTQ